MNHLPHGTTLDEATAKVKKILDRSDLSKEQKSIVKVYFIFDVHKYVELVNTEAETMLEIGKCKYNYERLKKKLIKETKQDKYETMKDIDEQRKEINTLE